MPPKKKPKINLERQHTLFSLPGGLDVPLGEITNLRPLESTVEDPVSGLRPLESIVEGPVSGLRKPSHGDVNTAKRPCVSRNGVSTAAVEPTLSCTRIMTGFDNGRPAPLTSKPTSVASDFVQGKQTSVAVTPVRERLTTPVGSNGRATPGSTPRRPKRKFPGPAGLLPKLLPGQSMDAVSVPGVTATDPDKSNKEDTVILSSQSSDDVFLDTPWQTLLSDLGEEDAQLLKKFSIASISLKASKKLLVKGKVAMVFAVIECLDTHGSDASVTLRDKSGRIQGTVHRDLLKDYEAELQPGTVVVFRQVSVISLTNKNHYLNITPANIVVLYQNKNSQLQKVKFHGSQDSLRSVLVSLEKKASQDLTDGSSAHGTPESVNSSRLSSTGRNSSASTPVLFNAMLNETMSNLRNQGSGGGSFTPRAPGMRHVSFTPRVPGVRDVRFTPSAGRRPNVSVRQNLYQQTTPQTQSGVRVPNPENPNANFRTTNSANTHVPNTNSVRPTSTPGQRTTPNVIPPNMPVSSSSYRFKPNASAGVQITPVSNVSVPNINNHTSSSTILQSNMPVANTSNVSTGQRTTQLLNRSMSTSSVNGNHHTFPAPTTSSIDNRLAGISPLCSTNIAATVGVTHSSNVAVSSHVNAVIPNSVTNKDKTSPESSSNKRKWSFKSPTSSPNLFAPQASVSGAQTNSGAKVNSGVQMNISAQRNTSTSQTNDSFKRINLGQRSNYTFSSDADTRTSSSGRDKSARNILTNSANQSRQSSADVTASVTATEQSSSSKKFGDFNNNQGTPGNVTRVTKSKWSFKSKTVTSPKIPEKSSPLLIGPNGSCDTSTTKVEDLWQDDLSDELLSQLSEEMM